MRLYFVWESCADGESVRTRESDCVSARQIESVDANPRGVSVSAGRVGRGLAIVDLACCRCCYLIIIIIITDHGPHCVL